MAVSAFSSISTNLPFPTNSGQDATVASNLREATDDNVQETVSFPWRVVLDIGREPLARMPFDWARSGCRMPLVIPCDFSHNRNDQESLILPRSETVSFTGPDGAVVKPVVGGDWRLSDDQKQLSLSLSFPETLQRRDVSINAGTTLELTTRVYTQAELDQLNEAYYQARENTWQVGGDLNDIARQQSAPKKWNEAKGRWEKPQNANNILATIQKRVSYLAAKADQDQKNRQRPDPNTISDRGLLPGVDGGVYIAKGGVVRESQNGPVMGTWQAQPITNMPVSYR